MMNAPRPKSSTSSTRTSLLLLLLATTGCTSFSSTPISRSDDNTFQGDSNGRLRIFERSRPFKGTPVKLRVQTHTDIFIDEKYFLSNEAGHWKELQLGNRFYQVRSVPIATDQVVMVDFKRPASGTQDLKLAYNDQQYLKSVNSKFVDTTLKDSANLVGTIVKTFADTVAAGPQKDSSTPSRITPVTRTIAYQRFDINAVDYEQQLDAFVNMHLNGCREQAMPVLLHQESAPVLSEIPLLTP